MRQLQARATSKFVTYSKTTTVSQIRAFSCIRLRPSLAPKSRKRRQYHTLAPFLLHASKTTTVSHFAPLGILYPSKTTNKSHFLALPRAGPETTNGCHLCQVRALKCDPCYGFVSIAFWRPLLEGLWASKNGTPPRRYALLMTFGDVRNQGFANLK